MRKPASLSQTDTVADEARQVEHFTGLQDLLENVVPIKQDPFARRKTASGPFWHDYVSLMRRDMWMRSPEDVLHRLTRGKSIYVCMPADSQPLPIIPGFDSITSPESLSLIEDLEIPLFVKSTS